MNDERRVIASSSSFIVHRSSLTWYLVPVAGATRLAGDTRRSRYDAVIALGCLLRGDTPHFEFISAQVTNELSRVAVDTQSPVAFGVITCNTHEQAVERSSKGSGNKGWEAALAAIEMANLFRTMKDER